MTLLLRKTQGTPIHSCNKYYALLPRVMPSLIALYFERNNKVVIY